MPPAYMCLDLLLYISEYPPDFPIDIAVSPETWSAQMETIELLQQHLEIEDVLYKEGRFRCIRKTDRGFRANMAALKEPFPDDLSVPIPLRQFVELAFFHDVYLKLIVTEPGTSFTLEVPHTYTFTWIVAALDESRSLVEFWYKVGNILTVKRRGGQTDGLVDAISKLDIN